MSLRNVKDLLNTAHWIGENLLGIKSPSKEVIKLIGADENGKLQFPPEFLEPNDQSTQRQKDHSNSEEQSL